jgi:hypothetical protein
MPKLSFLILFLFFTFNTQADEFKVVSFRADPSDLAARKFEKKDANDRACAIIKVQTDAEGLKFESNIGIADLVVKTGEYWVYVSQGEKRLRILKEGFLPLEYNIPLLVKASEVYIMIVRKTGVGTVIYPGASANTGMLLLKTEPPGADLYINREYGGRTPFQKEMEEGKYSFRVQKKNFYSKEGSVQVRVNQTTNQVIQLIPNFGSVKFHVLPEPGATIELDGFTL